MAVDPLLNFAYTVNNDVPGAVNVGESIDFDSSMTTGPAETVRSGLGRHPGSTNRTLCR